MAAAHQMIKEKDNFVRKTFHEISTPCHILLQVCHSPIACEHALRDHVAGLGPLLLIELGNRQ